MDFEDIMPTFEEPEDDLGVITPEKPKTAKNDKNLALEMLRVQNDWLTSLVDEQKAKNTELTKKEQKGKQLAGMTFGRAALIGWDMVEQKARRNQQKEIDEAQNNKQLLKDVINEKTSFDVLERDEYIDLSALLDEVQKNERGQEL